MPQLRTNNSNEINMAREKGFVVLYQVRDDLRLRPNEYIMYPRSRSGRGEIMPRHYFH